MKISEALEKAGYGEKLPVKAVDQDEVEKENSPARARDRLDRRQDTEQKQEGKSSSGSWDERLFKAANADAYLPEVFKTLRSRILHPINDERIPRTILVTSALPREGKSFISANLGISLAQGMDQHSLLVDCDLRKPVLARMFGLDNRSGLVDHLKDHVPLPQLIAKTSVSSLSLLPSGKPPVNPAELLSSMRMSALVEELSGRYDDRIIIFDSPPLLIAAESSVLAGQVDAIILVVRQSASGKAQIQKVIDLIGTDRILGIVFNGQDINPLQKRIVKGYGSYHGSYYQS